MKADLLASASWLCAASPPGAVVDAAGLADFGGRWIPAAVPGTAASAVRATDGLHEALLVDYDGQDWWFRTTFEAVPDDGPWLLTFGGLATLADVWLNGTHLVHAENMFRQTAIELDSLLAHNALDIRFAALTPELKRRRPRPRWRASLVREQNLRWFRTSLLGRMPGWASHAAPVGPWRAISLRRRIGVEVVRCALHATVDRIYRVDDGTDRTDGADADGRVAASGAVDVELVLRLPDGVEGTSAMIRVGDHEQSVILQQTVRCRVVVSDVALWWPHTHGTPSRYAVSLEAGDDCVELGTVGFRTIDADVSSNGFALVVNGERVFARGACWVPPDVVGLNAGRDAVRAAVAIQRECGLNMLRVTGTMVYENGDFFDACDELGMLVWQDVMLATLDPPADANFVGEIDAEVRELCAMLRSRPSLAVLCGGSECEQQPAYLGLPAAERHLDLIERLIPELVAALLPGIPYVTSSPSGGDPPTRLDEGVAQYFGVGAYLRPLVDVKLAGVRFAGECLAFAIPPERVTVDDVFGGPTLAGHDPRWKQAVPRDATASWDFEDVRDFYVREIFGVDPMLTRYADPARALDLGRAATAHVFETVFGHWRRPDVACAGALVLAGADLWPGAGWGLVDAYGRPKAPWYALRRLLAPVAVFVSDEGLDGLLAHVVNDTASLLSGRLHVELFDLAGRRVAAESIELEIPARGGRKVPLTSVFDGFRDLNHAFRFGPATYDAVWVGFVDGDALVADVVHLPLGQARPQLPDVGLTAHARRVGDGWVLDVATQHLAQWVAIDIPGFRPADSWFHLRPSGTRSVHLELDSHALAREPIPRGYVRALNSVPESAVVFD
ncbi:MAG TPA: glycoside hydrolase family 2 protein [Acidothermaceae bacterium]